MYKNSEARERVLAFVRQQGSASVAELAGALGIVQVTAREHLKGLEDQGLLRSEAERGALGRPHLRFTLTAQAEGLLPQRYAGLASDVIGSVVALAGLHGLDQVLDAAAAKYASEHAPVPGCATLEDRVAHAARVLRGESGEVQLEARPGGYGISTSICPYAAIARQFAGVCRYHLLVISKLGRAEVTLEEALPHGQGRCLFAVTEPARRPFGVRLVSDGRQKP
ncbi:MAG: helix-turn-helix transcriptional regulator [Chloroflexota bacterium]